MRRCIPYFVIDDFDIEERIKSQKKDERQK